jgi:hypothetical protein
MKENKEELIRSVHMFLGVILYCSIILTAVKLLIYFK